ncbi:hypothetical protein LSUB1_G007447 [Lachnellula subtilissima]|uniref:Uncharacterized protein n=1 Tax=Lachnellula subtilissima TaxID=602034 RepID=A0A8H8U5I3_9HELO|nr:hypothetical protein LSUB1_G007447 [Lachnellula subtilissima]
MSTTSTAGTTITAQQLQGVLSDYTVRFTGDDSTTRHDGIEPPNSVEAPSFENPPNWPRNHYRVPDYRPANRNLSTEERPKGSNAVEFAFLTIMFTGVYLNSVGDRSPFMDELYADVLKAAAKIWGRTGGPYFPGLFRKWKRQNDNVEEPVRVYAVMENMSNYGFLVLQRIDCAMKNMAITGGGVSQAAYSAHIA